MVFTVPIFSPSEKVRQRNYHKVYAIDWALAQAIAPADGVDISRQLENMVYLELRRRGWNVSYFRTRQGWEINFVAIHKTARSHRPLICQVAYSLKDKEVRERELRGVAETARHLRVARVHRLFYCAYNGATGANETIAGVDASCRDRAGPVFLVVLPADSSALRRNTPTVGCAEAGLTTCGRRVRRLDLPGVPVTLFPTHYVEVTCAQATCRLKFVLVFRGLVL
jgi:hypothetical protein